mgnify:CR=1 FL=1|jgi:hypothetical protein
MRSIDGEVYSFNIFKAPSAIPSAGGAFCSFCIAEPSFLLTISRLAIIIEQSK